MIFVLAFSAVGALSAFGKLSKNVTLILLGVIVAGYFYGTSKAGQTSAGGAQQS